MRFLLDTNILIPLEDSQHPLERSLANFVQLANANGHILLYHPASEDDINQDSNITRRTQTLGRLHQYTKLDSRPVCPWNLPGTSRNDAADNEILYSIELNAAHALVTEDRGIHAKAKDRGLAQRVYSIQTAEDQLRRLHEIQSVQLPNIEDVPLYELTPELNSEFFNSLRGGYPEFDSWFREKAQEGRRAWINRDENDLLGGICIYDRQVDERITDSTTLPGPALKISTFKVGETNRGRKIGELFLKTAFRYATTNRLENIFIHGDVDSHRFLFAMFEDFGFTNVGRHPDGSGRDAVYLKAHPINAPQDQLSSFEYSKKYFPHFRYDTEVAKYIIPIQPQYHRILFPDYDSSMDQQMLLFQPEITAGNAIKMAYLCHAQTNTINLGDLMLFYRSTDEKTITSLGVVESYEQSNDADVIAMKVKRRTVYAMEEIKTMAQRPTRVLLFRLVKHFSNPLPIAWLRQEDVLKGYPQSITKISDASFEKVLAHGG